jgi:hypothetical protein
MARGRGAPAAATTAGARGGVERSIEIDERVRSGAAAPTWVIVQQHAARSDASGAGARCVVPSLVLGQQHAERATPS